LVLSQSSDILQDALLILASKEIKLSSSRAHAPEDEDDPESAISAAKGKLLSKIVKKNILENIVPILIELKHLLEKHRSPLLKYLMLYLKELLKDFKSELQDIVVGDKQLAKELEYDLRMWEKKGTTVTVVSPPPHQGMFSPKPRNTPRPDLAKFSVPKLRPSPSFNVMPKTPRSTTSSSSGSKTPFAKTPSGNVATPSFSRPSPQNAESPYKTPIKKEKDHDDDGSNHIAFTPETNKLRRWSIELVSDENDSNASNKIAKKATRSSSSAQEEPTKSRGAKKHKKEAESDDEVQHPVPPPNKKRRSRNEWKDGSLVAS